MVRLELRKRLRATSAEIKMPQSPTSYLSSGCDFEYKFIDFKLIFFRTSQRDWSRGAKAS